MSAPIKHANAMDADAKLNEQATKAAHSAELLTQDLRELHRALCVDKPTAAQRISERYALDLIRRAAELREELKGIAP